MKHKVPSRGKQVKMLAVLTAVFCVGPIWIGTTGKAESGNKQFSRGKTVYVKYCAGCHGIEGRGDGYRILGADPVDLTSPSIKQTPDSALLKSIHEGKPNMPSWKLRLSEEDRRNVLAYIRTLGNKNGSEKRREK